jgi:hypothetical protein
LKNSPISPWGDKDIERYHGGGDTIRETMKKGKIGLKTEENGKIK